MKYFFIPNDENSKNLTFMRKIWDGKEIGLIMNEELLKHYIQENKIKDFKKIKPFRVGSLVKIAEERPVGWATGGEMDEFLGMEVVITEFNASRIRFDGDKHWHISPYEIVEVLKY